MRAISTLSLLAGISTVSCDAWMALRTRVRKSAMGSVMDMLRAAPATSCSSSCPGCSRRARARAGRSGTGRTCERRSGRGRTGGSGCTRGSCTWRGVPDARAARAWPSGLGGFLGSLDVRVAVAAERHAEGLEQRVGLGVGLGARRDRDVEASDRVDLVVVDLGEDDLLAQADGVVA